MKYALKLTYKDGKFLEVLLKEEDAQDFFSCLSEAKIHWEKDTGKGFWTSLAEVRYIEAVPQEVRVAKEVQAAKEVKVDKEMQVEDGSKRDFRVPTEA